MTVVVGVEGVMVVTALVVVVVERVLVVVAGVEWPAVPPLRRAGVEQVHHGQVHHLVAEILCVNVGDVCNLSCVVVVVAVSPLVTELMPVKFARSAYIPR